jgi:hypothetical protein
VEYVVANAIDKEKWGKGKAETEQVEYNDVIISFLCTDFCFTLPLFSFVSKKFLL